MGIERRKFARYRMDLAAIVHVGGGGRTLNARTWDISSAGLFIMTEATVARGTRVEIAVIDPDQDETYFLAGTVVHVAVGRGLGIQFTPLSPRTAGRLTQLLDRLATLGPPLGASS